MHMQNNIKIWLYIVFIRDVYIFHSLIQLACGIIISQLINYVNHMGKTYICYVNCVKIENLYLNFQMMWENLKEMLECTG